MLEESNAKSNTKPNTPKTKIERSNALVRACKGKEVNTIIRPERDNGGSRQRQ
jgi:hypothetical protein